MMRSLYSGVAGLRTHQTKMDVLGNNIANVNTTSFKSQSITFSDLMYQTTQTASGATETKGGVNARQIGLGAKSGAIATAIEGQGATQTTNNPFDIMITGKAFFVVNNGKENLYTRDGSFYVDGAGNLAMQSNGYLVQGWVAQEDKETGEIRVNKNGGLSGLQIMSPDNSTYSPASTTEALFSGNIDDHDSNIVSDDGKTITLEFYDNKGYLYTAKFTLKDTGTDHLFSLQLTDIIDSEGNSINKDLDPEGKDTVLNHVTFGTIQSDDKSVDELHYSVNVGKVANIDAKAGMEMFKGIPEEGGTLADLMTTSKTEYKNLLLDVYGLTDDDVIIGTQKKDASGNPVTDDDGNPVYNYPYGKNATYKIDPDTLDLVITYNVAPTEYTNIAKATDSYTGTNTKNYFVNSTTGEAYLAPTPTTGEGYKLKSATLKEIFGITDEDLIRDYQTETLGYTYKYANKKLTVYSGTTLPQNDTNYDKINDLNEFKTLYATQFEGLEEYFDNTTADGYYYNYDGTTLSLKPYTNDISPDESRQTGTADVPSSAVTPILDYLTDTPLSINHVDGTLAAILNASGISVSDDLPTYTDPGTGDVTETELYTCTVTNNQYTLTLFDANGNTTGTYTGPAVNPLDGYNKNQIYKLSDGTAKADISNATGLTADEIDAKGKYFKIVSLSGTDAIIFYDEKVEEQLGTASTFTAAYTEYPVTASGFTESTAFENVYSNEDGSAWVFMKKDEYTLNDIPKEVLSNVFGLDKDSIISTIGKNAQDIDVTLNKSSGALSISYVDTDKPKKSDDFNVNYDSTTQTYFYTTSKDTPAYENVPLTGKITDLLETADKETGYPGLLSKVYGVSDEDADAFGTDGTYVINASGITLSTGTHTIQLTFDSATGSLKTANGLDAKGLAAGKVDMVFDQDIDIFAPFGYQKASTDGADVIPGRVSIDFSTVTNYNTNGSSTIKVVKGDKKSLNTGRAVGEMNGVTVSTDGQIFATYSNGQTKLLGQIASAEFANASGLSKEGDNLYASTLNSGEATIQDITTDGGYMNTGVLEMSNVDLSKEFTEMITTQRGFQANSRIITVSDTLLEELTNLKR